MPRPIIAVDEEKCNGCGQCIPDCAEGALAIVNGKAKLISEVYCDGLGACLNCPQGALTLNMRDAPPFDEEAALKAKKEREEAAAKAGEKGLKRLLPLAGSLHGIAAQISTWPMQLLLLPPNAAFLKNAPLLLAAHCAGFAAADIQARMKDRALAIACPKLENKDALVDRLAGIIAANDTPAIDILRMSVPCCGLPAIVEQAIAKSGKKLHLGVEVVKLGQAQ